MTLVIKSDLSPQTSPCKCCVANVILEQTSRDVHEVLIVARKNHQVTQEHVSILLTCVQELIVEVNQTQSLSHKFSEKYMG